MYNVGRDIVLEGPAEDGFGGSPENLTTDRGCGPSAARRRHMRSWRPIIPARPISRTTWASLQFDSGTHGFYNQSNHVDSSEETARVSWFGVFFRGSSRCLLSHVTYFS